MPGASRARTQTLLLRATRLGAAVARADLACSAQDVTLAMNGWRRLQGYCDRDTQAVLQVAFDTGYGRQLSQQTAPV